MIHSKWHFVPVFPGDLCTAVHTFSYSSNTVKSGYDYVWYSIDFNTKHDQLSLVSLVEGCLGVLSASCKM